MIDEYGSNCGLIIRMGKPKELRKEPALVSLLPPGMSLEVTGN
jgi:hypothetical protein